MPSYRRRLDEEIIATPVTVNGQITAYRIEGASVRTVPASIFEALYELSDSRSLTFQAVFEPGHVPVAGNRLSQPEPPVDRPVREGNPDV